jgi:hypothetical protein
MLASILCVAQSSQGAGRFATASTSFAGMEHNDGLAMNRGRHDAAQHRDDGWIFRAFISRCGGAAEPTGLASAT